MTDPLEGERWRVIEGDCLDVLQALPVGSVDAVVTDPPYNAINRRTAGLRRIDKGAVDSAPVDIAAVAGLLVRASRGSIYVWCSDEQYTAWTMAFKTAGLATRICAWRKSNPSPMNGESLWLSGLELCVFARKPLAYFVARCQVPLWTGPSEPRDDHPTAKPVWLMKRLILASCPSKGVVLDAFTGSGSTGVAALEEDRRFLGIEREADYCAIARRRIAEAAAQGNLFEAP